MYKIWNGRVVFRTVLGECPSDVIGIPTPIAEDGEILGRYRILEVLYPAEEASNTICYKVLRVQSLENGSI
jgi:hypothetical protein